MEFPKLIYQDFYKFLMSVGIILLVIGLALMAQNQDLSPKIFEYLGWILPLISIYIMWWAGNKWHINQKLYDKQELLKTKKLEGPGPYEMLAQRKRGILDIIKEILEAIRDYIINKNKDRSDTAVVSYKIASALPEFNTKQFDFLEDGKVWFLIQNHERKKYKAYIKIKFISDNYEEEVTESYYGGIKAWNLNALSITIAPGLGIPRAIREKARQKKKIEIRISCEIKNENDETIETKLPAGYVYDYKNNSWYYEP